MSGAIIAVGALGVMVCCSSSSAAMMMMGGDSDSTTSTNSTGPSTPPPPTPVLRNTPETMRCASTVWSGEAIGTGHGRGRLDSVQGWSAQHNTVGGMVSN